MSSRSRRIGTDAEVRVEAYLKANGVTARRNPLRGTKDEGDIWTPGCILSVKDDKSLRIGEWLRDAEEQAANAGEPGYLLVVKERRGPKQTGRVEDWWVICRLKDLAA